MKLPAGLLLAFAAGQLGAQTPPPAALSIQQQFDAASVALESENWAEALRLFEALEARTRSPRSLAIIRTRKASALLELGRLAETGAALRIAIPDLPVDEESLFVDRYLGLVTLGRLAETALDYEEALRQFRAAAAIPIPPADRLTALRGLIQTQLFTDAEAALREADEALRIVMTLPEADRAIEGQVRTLRGRALLNLGRFANARAELDLAMRRLGNLTLRVDRADIIARSDLATAALLAGDQRDARRYLAFTGAGRLGEDGHVSVPIDYELPECGPDIAPSDVVVVQFLIENDGRVAAIVPVYSSRSGPAALRFARAIARSRFDSESLRTIPPLLRSAVRLEMRCTLDGQRTPSEASTNVSALLGAADPAWQATLSALAAQPATVVRAELAARERAGGGSRALLPVLAVLTEHGGVAQGERTEVLRRTLTVAAEAEAPPRAIAGLALSIIWDQHRAQRKRWDQPPDFDAAASLPEVRGSPAAIAAIRLAEAGYYFGRRLDAEATVRIATVRAVPGLEPGNPTLAAARSLASRIRAATGDLAGARAEQASGCGPARRSTAIAVSDNDFPQEAIRWGFEGWAVSEAAVDAAGITGTPRTVLAYPAFVFGDAVNRATRRTRYDPAILPEGEVCSPARIRVRFVLPHISGPPR